MSVFDRLLNRAALAAQRFFEEAAAIRPGTDLADQFGSFGEASYISAPSGAMVGVGSIHVGTGTLIGKRCSLMVGYGPDEPNPPARGLVIGDRVVLGAGATITAHRSIEIGNDVWFGNGVFISDSSHGYQQPELAIGDQLGGHAPVRIGAGSWIGHGVIILPGAQIGEHVVVGAGSVVRGQVENHAVVAGVPARVVRSFDPERGWVSATDPTDVRPIWSLAHYEAALRGEVDLT